MSGRVNRDLTPSRAGSLRTAAYLVPPLLPHVSRCGFRAAAGLGVPSGLMVTVSEPGRREQAAGREPEYSLHFLRGIPVTLRGLRILAFCAGSGIPVGAFTTHRHGYDPAHPPHSISRTSGACSAKCINTDMLPPVASALPRPPRPRRLPDAAMSYRRERA